MLQKIYLLESSLYNFGHILGDDCGYCPDGLPGQKGEPGFQGIDGWKGYFLDFIKIIMLTNFITVLPVLMVPSDTQARKVNFSYSDILHKAQI